MGTGGGLRLFLCVFQSLLQCLLFAMYSSAGMGIAAVWCSLGPPPRGGELYLSPCQWSQEPQPASFCEPLKRASPASAPSACSVRLPPSWLMGSAWRKSPFGTVLQHYQIKHAPHHPESSGQVGRMNETLKAALQQTVSDSGRNWVDQLPLSLALICSS